MEQLNEAIKGDIEGLGEDERKHLQFLAKAIDSGRYSIQVQDNEVFLAVHCGNGTAYFFKRMWIGDMPQAKTSKG